MKLPPRLASWFRAVRRAHERQEEEHLRAMAKANPWRGGRRVRLPPPPGGWDKGRRRLRGVLADGMRRSNGPFERQILIVG